MRILYLHQYFNTPSMSGGTRSFEFGRRFVSAGHDVHVVTSHRDGTAPVRRGWYQTVEAGMQVHWLLNPYSNKMSYPRRIFSFINYAIKSIPKVSSINADIILASSTPLTIAIPALYASYIHQIPLVFEIRDLWPAGPIEVGALKNSFIISVAKYLERTAYAKSSHVIALSSIMEHGIIATGYPKHKVTIIPNSSDIELFRIPAEVGQKFLNEHPYLSAGPLVVYCGTLGLLNTVQYLVEIAGQMLKIDPSARFLIVGDGRERISIHNKAVQLGVLHRNLWIFPKVPKKQVPAILSACTIACSLGIELPHCQAEAANKVFDTFAAGRPLLINHGGLVADILNETGAGIVVPSGDSVTAASQLHRFLHDKEALSRARRASANLADTRFNRDRHAEQLLNILELAAKAS